jgi:hypothetical protein
LTLNATNATKPLFFAGRWALKKSGNEQLNSSYFENPSWISIRWKDCNELEIPIQNLMMNDYTSAFTILWCFRLIPNSSLEK